MKLHQPSLFVFLFTISIVVASEGDRSAFYQNCVKSCMKSNCTTDESYTEEAALKQDVWCKMLQWGCRDDCRYLCMWKTVQGFEERGYQIPKFHGKWPFKRVLGVQEPASALASLLNLFSHAYMYSKLRAAFSFRDTPLVLFWHVFAFVCMHAWSWSTIFHTRDTHFTEFMDYACALSMVMALFIAAVIRVFHRRRKLTCAIVVLTVLYYIEHARYLYSGRIDYSYNMTVNVFFGVGGLVLWLAWSLAQVARGAAGSAGAARAASCTLLSGAALLLELAEFPPVLAWDAHALWHLATAPLPMLFYRFVIDDLAYIKRTSLYEKVDLKLT